MTKAEKRSRLKEIVSLLEELYPDAECALKYGGDPWKLLVMARLSAQCTDARVNLVSEVLFSRFPNAQSMADADINDIEEIIRSCGLYKMKAKNIKECSLQLVRDFDGVLPDDMDSLLKLSGVGRKIANLLLGDIYGKDAVVCDTHCIRISGRLGMYPEREKNPVKIERILRELIEPSEGADYCHRIVNFGRDVCTARSPKCDACPLADLCKKKEREG